MQQSSVTFQKTENLDSFQQLWTLQGAFLNGVIHIWSDFDRASSLIYRNKMPTRCNRWFLLQILLLAQHVSGTIMAIIRSSRVLYRRLLPVVFGALVFKLSVWCWVTQHQTDNLKTKAPNTTGSSLLYNTLELPMMGIMVPETCWASNKFWNKNHLLHLGVLNVIFQFSYIFFSNITSKRPTAWLCYEYSSREYNHKIKE